jgi:ADP-ribosylglycohydrolase
MYGAILGDIIGSPYEFDEQNIKTKDFPLFRKESQFTDDSVMTIAVADALMKMIDMNIVDPWSHHEFEGDEDERQLEIEFMITQSLKKWGNRYPDAGYGARFIKWLRSGTGPYNSCGNGSAMRVSSAGWLYDDFAETRFMARYSAIVTHDHPEGMKGAEAVAAAIYCARKGWSKKQIRDLIACEYQYDLSRTCDEIRPSYHHVETCQGTVPEAVTAFLEGKDFEDVIRTAVSLGGDCDTLTCIAGSIAEAFYGVPDDLKEECRKRVTPEMLEILDRFDEIRK